MLMKEIRNLKVWTEAFDQCETTLDDLRVLYEFFKTLKKLFTGSNGKNDQR